MADVRIYVASYNTRLATELCIRTMRRLAGHPFELVIGDSGSTDGSLEMLKEFETEGWLEVESRPGRQHAEWIDDWLGRDESRFTVVSDSDIQFLRRGWLRSMVATAERRAAAVVHTEYVPAAEHFVHPRSGERVRLAGRPAPWLFLVDRSQVANVSESFAEHQAPPSEGQSTPIVYDVGARYFEAVERSGLRVVSMPRWFRLSYRHYGGQSWIPDESEMADKKARDRRKIDERLSYSRLLDAGQNRRGLRIAMRVESKAALENAQRNVKKAQDPRRVAGRIRRAISAR